MLHTRYVLLCLWSAAVAYAYNNDTYTYIVVIVFIIVVGLLLRRVAPVCHKYNIASKSVHYYIIIYIYYYLIQPAAGERNRVL